MDANEKLFRKLTKRERKALQQLLDALLAGDKSLDVKKLKGTDFYRARKGRFRVIFHYTKVGGVEIDSIRLRNERTYKR